jgi:hypothetical protein
LQECSAEGFKSRRKNGANKGVINKKFNNYRFINILAKNTYGRRMRTKYNERSKRKGKWRMR